MTQQAILTVPWVVLEEATPPAPVTAERDLVTVCAQMVATPVLPAAAAPDDASKRPFYVTLGASVAWVFVVVAMLLTGAMFPIAGNVLAYLVLMAGLIIAALVALTCPRPDGDETFITLGGYPVGQCAPSRNTLTGRGDR